MLNEWANQCSRCERWRKSKLVNLTKYQRCHLCKPCLEGRGPFIEAAPKRAAKWSIRKMKAREDWVDLDLAEMYDARIHARPIQGTNREVLEAALRALAVPGYLTVRSLRPGSEGKIVNGIVNPIEEAA